MFGISVRETQLLSGVSLVVTMAAGCVVYWMSRKRPSPDELERDRGISGQLERLVQVSRYAAAYSAH